MADGKQGIYFAWPNASLYLSFHSTSADYIFLQLSILQETYQILKNVVYV